MDRRTIAALAILLATLPLAAREPPEDDFLGKDANPLAGYSIELETPSVVLLVEGDQVSQPAREATLLLDGRAAAILEIPGGKAALPRRRWTLLDWLKAGGLALGVGAAGYVAGRVVQALR